MDRPLLRFEAVKSEPDEPTGIQDTATNPLADSIAAASEEVFKRHPTGSQGPDQPLASASQALPGGSPDALADRQATRDSVLGVLRVFDGFIKAKIEKRAAAIPGVAPQFVEEVTRAASLPDEQAVHMAELTATVAQKHGWNLKNAPEWGLAISAVGYLGTVVYAIHKLSEREKLQNN